MVIINTSWKSGIANNPATIWSHRCQIHGILLYMVNNTYRHRGPKRWTSWLIINDWMPKDKTCDPGLNECSIQFCDWQSSAVELMMLSAMSTAILCTKNIVLKTLWIKYQHRISTGSHSKVPPFTWEGESPFLVYILSQKRNQSNSTQQSIQQQARVVHLFVE